MTIIIKTGIRAAYSDYVDRWQTANCVSVNEAIERAYRHMGQKCSFGRSFPAKVLVNGRTLSWGEMTAILTPPTTKVTEVKS